MVDLRGTTILALACGLLLSTSGAISRAGADEASDYLAAAGDEVSAFTDCIYKHAKPLMRTQLTEDEVAARAVSECQSEAGAIAIALEGAPTHLSEADAKQNEQAVIEQAQKGLAADVKAKR
jgi:hypothetical protein